MYPILFEWGEFLVPAWHTFFVLGAMACFSLFQTLSKRHIPEITEKDISWLFVVSYIGGYFGARLLSIFIDQPDIKGLGSTISALFVLGPMTFYGGFILSFLAGLAYALKRGLPVLKLVDVVFIACFIGLALGRVGCFLNGDDYGVEISSTHWWTVSFSNHPYPTPRIPVQLFEAFFAALISLGCFWKFSKLKEHLTDGSLGMIAVGLYAITRFFLEYLRGDPRGWVIEGVLSPSQLISVLIVFLLLIIYFFILRKNSANKQ